MRCAVVAIGLSVGFLVGPWACLWPPLEPVAAFCSDAVICDETAPFCDADGSVAGIANSCIAVPPGRCLSSTDCPVAQACDLGERRCGPCAENDECASGVCIRSIAQCVAPSLIVYVDADAGEDRAGCGEQALPCKTLGGQAGALGRIDGERKTIKLAGTFDEAVTFSVDARLVGPATMIVAIALPAIAVQDGADLDIDDLTFSGGNGFLDGALTCDAASLELERSAILDNDHTALFATGCVVRVVDSIIADNRGLGIDATGGHVAVRRSEIARNESGGLRFATPQSFFVQNNFIVENGSAGSAVGGARFEDAATAFERIFRYNTVAANRSGSGSDVAGVSCAGIEVEVHSNIVFDNVKSGGGSFQIAGDCLWSHSDIEDIVPAGNDGGNNIAGNPGFVDAENGDYHLRDDSVCRDAGLLLVPD
jgi:hypothetical protein